MSKYGFLSDKFPTNDVFILTFSTHKWVAKVLLSYFGSSVSKKIGKPINALSPILNH